MTFDDIDIRLEAGAAAENEIKSLSSQSKLQRCQENEVHELAWEDIQTAEPIGIGGFSRVYSVKVLNHPQLFGENQNEETSFALKCLNTKTMGKETSFITGAKDLAVEGEILSRLHHENIIQLHGISSGGPKVAFTESEKGYFLVLDMLKDTLSNKLEAYRKKSNKKTRKAMKVSAKSSDLVGKFSAYSSANDRIKTVALGVAKGLAYLHQKGVALRDLKPDNVGFDQDGNVKIFDLGFAREVHTIQELEIAGSLRYMAPEVALGNGSSLASDVYSFGVLFWELCTLEKPFKEFATKDEFMQNVIVENFRPSLLLIQSPAMRRLISECWDPNPESRPTMDRVVKVLRIETLQLGSVPVSPFSVEQEPRPGNECDVDSTNQHNMAPIGGMAMLNASFGISCSDLPIGGRSNSFRRLNSWATKLSSSSLTLRNSLSRSGLTTPRKSAKKRVTIGGPANGSLPSMLVQLSDNDKTNANATFELSTIVPLKKDGESALPRKPNMFLLPLKRSTSLGATSMSENSQQHTIGKLSRQPNPLHAETSPALTSSFSENKPQKGYKMDHGGQKSFLSGAIMKNLALSQLNHKSSSTRMIPFSQQQTRQEPKLSFELLRPNDRSHTDHQIQTFCTRATIEELLPSLEETSGCFETSDEMIVPNKEADSFYMMDGRRFSDSCPELEFDLEEEIKLD